jgi:hypothetical protein
LGGHLCCDGQTSMDLVLILHILVFNFISTMSIMSVTLMFCFIEFYVLFENTHMYDTKISEDGGGGYAIHIFVKTKIRR